MIIVLSKTLNCLSDKVLYIELIMKVDFPNSSSIRSIQLVDNDVTVVYTSSDRKYSFTTTSPEVVEEYLENPTGSVGQTCNRWVSEGVLKAVQMAAV